MTTPTSLGALQVLSSTTSGIPIAERFFEDYLIGEVTEFGHYPIDESEIVEFATLYDPQVFHLDKEAAKASSFGGLVASGWNTVGITMRLMVLHFISARSSMGSPGVDQIRWLMPVFPGDILSVRLTVTATKRSTSKPDRGMLWFETETRNQNGQVVMTMKGLGMNRCRTDQPNDAG